MLYSKEDFLILLRATVKIYLKSLQEAWAVCVRNPFVLLIHFSCLFCFTILLFIAMPFGRLFGGFILGFGACYLLAVYLSTINTAVEKERVNFKTAWSAGGELFSSVIGVLFVFFIIDLLLGAVLQDPSSLWIKASIEMLMAVLFNPLPELLYQRSDGTMSLFSESLEFINENFIEWFLPFVLFLALIFIFNPNSSNGFVLLLAITNPLVLLEYSMSYIANFKTLLISAPVLLVLLYGVYFIFVFRGFLFKSLSSSTRRKRIYREKFEN